MNFLQYAIWGAYLTSMARYLGPVGFGDEIGLFYSILGIVSIFMPAIMGIIADKLVPAQRLLGLSHLLSALFIIGAGYYGFMAGNNVSFPIFFSLFSLSGAFYMPTLALSNSVAFSILKDNDFDTVKHFPQIRISGTIGFVASMWTVDLLGFQTTPAQFLMSGILGLVLFLYTFTLPACSITRSNKNQSFSERMGMTAFKLFKQKKMAVFFIFAALLGISLQITNGFANPFISSFEAIPMYATTFGVQHSNILVSLSQISETFCILLIPLFFKQMGIKKVMLIAMGAWVLRFFLFACGNPGTGVWFLVFSMVVYGVAFDFFNVAGSLFVDGEIDINNRSSAQGLFFLMTNGIGATVGTLAAQQVVNQFCSWQTVNIKGVTKSLLLGDWTSVWLIFAGYSLIVMVAFALVFKNGVEKPAGKLR